MPKELRFPLLNDEELVILALVGDLDAFDELVRRYRGAVLAVAEAVTGSRSLAEDVAQDTLLTAFRALPQLDDPARFPAWLYAIARHRARRLGKGSTRQMATEAEELDRLLVAHSGELSAHPGDALERGEAETELRTALDALPEAYRLVMRLYYYEEWSVGQIGAFLSLPPTTIKWRLHQGREWMRQRLAENSEEPTDVRTPIPAPARVRRGASPAQAAPRDREDRPRRQPHRHPGERRARFGAAV